MNVRQAEDDDHDPAAASSADGGGNVDETQAEPAEEGSGGMNEGEGTSVSSTVPRTGWGAPEQWDERDMSIVRDFSVDDFMEAELAKKFYKQRQENHGSHGWEEIWLRSPWQVLWPA